MSKNSRGTSYPVIPLDEAVAKMRVVFEKVGKGPSSKEEYIIGLGYKGHSGASSRMFAALVHFGLLSKAGNRYQFSDLAMNILFPKSGTDAEPEFLAQAALSPKLFQQLYERYKGQPLPTMLANTLIIDFQVHNKSAAEAATNFRQSLDYAQLIKGGVVNDVETPVAVGEPADSSDEDLSEPDYGTSDIGAVTSPIASMHQAVTMSGEDLNRIEIVLREGVKAGIYAPHNLSDDEKNKLKTIIDLL